MNSLGLVALTIIAVLFLEWIAFRVLKLHVCDQPREHPPRAFEVESEDANPDEELLG